MRKRTDAAQRAARTRRIKKMIAAEIERSRRVAFDTAIRACAAENPKGSTHAFIRWFEQAWRKAGAP